MTSSTTSFLQVYWCFRLYHNSSFIAIVVQHDYCFLELVTKLNVNHWQNTFGQLYPVYFDSVSDCQCGSRGGKSTLAISCGVHKTIVWRWFECGSTRPVYQISLYREEYLFSDCWIENQARATSPATEKGVRPWHHATTQWPPYSVAANLCPQVANVSCSHFGTRWVPPHLSSAPLLRVVHRQGEGLLILLTAVYNWKSPLPIPSSNMY